MRFRRAASWLMLFSPLLLLAWIGVTERVSSSLAVSIPGDPPGYASRVAEYAPFVAAARELHKHDVCNDPLSQEHMRLLQDALREADRPLPVVETTRFGVPLSEDIRGPILDAQRTVFYRAKAVVDALMDEGRRDEAAEIAFALVRNSMLMRYSDFSVHVGSTSEMLFAADELRRTLEGLSTPRLTWLREQLLSMEATRRSVSDLVRTDIHLLTTHIARLSNADGHKDILALVIEVHGALREGKSLQPYVKRVAMWPDMPYRERIWSMFAAWEIARRNERANREMMKNLIVDVRKLELRSQGKEPTADLALPEFLFSEDHERGLVAVTEPRL